METDVSNTTPHATLGVEDHDELTFDLWPIFAADLSVHVMRLQMALMTLKLGLYLLFLSMDLKE